MRLAALLVAVLGVLPATAAAAQVACVQTDAPDCTAQPDTLDAALASGAPLIRLGPGPFEGAFSSDDPVQLAGDAGTVIRAADLAQPALTLTGSAVNVHNVTVDGALKVGPQATLTNLAVTDLVLDHAATAARNLSVTNAVTVLGGTLSVSSTVVGAADPFVVSDAATVETDHSAYAADEDVDGADRRAPDATLVDAGDPAPLAAYEAFVDAAGDTRITDGDGDGTVRRDIGAFELQPPPTLPPTDNVLLNGGAEFGTSGWAGSFTAAAFGDPSLPSQRAATALAGGAHFFSGGAAAVATLFQRVDVAVDAEVIDQGESVASLSGLVGGYGADTDTLRVQAVFKDPEGKALGALELDPVTATTRGNTSNLLPRRASGPIPRRTRAIDVLLRGERQAGRYTDAYADNLGLELSVRGGPPLEPPAGPADPPVTGLRPFAGVTVLSAQPVVRGARMRIGLACASATVGGCRGTIDINARLPRAGAVTRIARTAAFDVAAGRTGVARLRLHDAARAVLRFRRGLRARLDVVAEDGQGLSRRAIVPIRLRLRARR